MIRVYTGLLLCPSVRLLFPHFAYSVFDFMGVCLLFALFVSGAGVQHGLAFIHLEIALTPLQCVFPF